MDWRSVKHCVGGRRLPTCSDSRTATALLKNTNCLPPGTAGEIWLESTEMGRSSAGLIGQRPGCTVHWDQLATAAARKRGCDPGRHRNGARPCRLRLSDVMLHARGRVLNVVAADLVVQTAQADAQQAGSGLPVTAGLVQCLHDSAAFGVLLRSRSSELRLQLRDCRAVRALGGNPRGRAAWGPRPGRKSSWLTAASHPP